MGSVTNVTVEWKGHSQFLMQGIMDFLRQEYLVDTSVTFYSDCFRVHNLMLAIFLPTFKQSLDDASSLPSSMLTKQLNLDYVANQSEDVQALVQFIYSGKVTVPVERLDYLSRLAADMQFEGLQKAIEDQQTKSTTTGPPRGSVEVVELPAANCQPNVDDVANEKPTCEAGNGVVGNGSEAGTVVIEELVYSGIANATFDVAEATLVMPDGTSEQCEQKMVYYRKRTNEGEPGKPTNISATASTVKFLRLVESRRYISNTGRGMNPLGANFDKRHAKKIREKWASSLATPRKPSFPLSSRRTGTPRNANVLPDRPSQHPQFRRDVVQKNHPRIKPARRNRTTTAAAGPAAGVNALPMKVPSVMMKELVCEKCQKRFSRKPSYVWHMERCGHEKPFKCPLCSFRGANRFEMKRHYTSDHQDELTWKCTFCKFATFSRSILTAHKYRNHTAVKRHRCPHCEYASMCKAEVVRHVRISHLKERNFMCETCGRRFSIAGELTKHVRFVHQGIKQYKCKYCGKEYKHYSTYKVHLGSKHTGDVVMQVCHICGNSYNRRWNLQVHMRRVHGCSLQSTKKVYVQIDPDDVTSSADVITVTALADTVQDGASTLPENLYNAATVTDLLTINPF